MAQEINYIARTNDAFTKLKSLINTQPFEKRDVIALDFDKLVDQLIVKHGKSKPKKVKILSIGDLRRKLEFVNFKKLSDSEMSDKDILEKMIEWQDEYTYIPWEDFRDHYFKCSDCGSYDNEPCICYAR